MKTTLVIMAAGLGSRFGGDKQLSGVGPNGEVLMEYSIYDALRAGFRRVVFVIRPEAREALERLTAPVRLPDGGPAEIAFAVQDFSSLPDFYRLPEGRTAPFGTAHAVLCAAKETEGPFCVVNADDYYGAEAFRTLRRALTRLPEAGEAVMVGYVLGNTLTPSGTVSRGVCQVENGFLQSVTERLKILEEPDGTLRDLDSGVTFPRDAVASMNLWGFAPSIFPELRRYFEDFLRTRGHDPKAECQIPGLVRELTGSRRLRVAVLESRERWFGMTYREDRTVVEERLRALHRQGVYPPRLWERET